jgi:hypothetical protein
MINMMKILKEDLRYIRIERFEIYHEIYQNNKRNTSDKSNFKILIIYPKMVTNHS